MISEEALAPSRRRVRAGFAPVTPGIWRVCVVFSLLGVVGIALILFVVVVATAGVVFGK